MPTFEYEVRFLEAAIPLLEHYIMSSEMYWAIGVHAPAGNPPYPQLTLGAVLLFHARAEARAQTADQQAVLARLSEQLDALRFHWRTAWSKKAAHEFEARLRLWRNFLEEYRENHRANFDRFKYEVRRRVQLHMLAEETTEIPQADHALLQGLDNVLKALFIPGPFIWDDELASSFPPDPYWYLYGKPREK